VAFQRLRKLILQDARARTHTHIHTHTSAST